MQIDLYQICFIRAAQEGDSAILAGLLKDNETSSFVDINTFFGPNNVYGVNDERATALSQPRLTDMPIVFNCCLTMRRVPIK